MATIAQLSADLKAGRPGARAAYILDWTPWHIGDEATTTIYAATTPAPPDVPGEVWPGLKVGTISQSLTTAGPPGLLSLIFGNTSLSLSTVEVPGMHHLPGILSYSTARLKGAVADEAMTAPIDGIPTTARIEAGTLFRVAGQSLYAWHVVTETATAVAGAATLKFWPACSGGWSDNARVLDRVAEPLDAPSDAVIWQGFYHENRVANLYALGWASPDVSVDEPADRVAWADRKTLISGARIEAPAIDTGDQSPGITLPLKPPGDRMERPLTLPSRGLGVLPVHGGGFVPVALPVAPYWYTSTAAPTVVNPDLVIYADVFLPGEMRGETVRKFLISTGEYNDATDNGWGLYYLPSDRTFRPYIHLNGTAYTVATPAASRLEGWYSVLAYWDASAAVLRAGLLEWDDITESVAWSSDQATGADTYTKGTLQMVLGRQITTAGIGTAATTFAGLMSLTLLSTAPANITAAEELLRRGPKIVEAPYETGLVASWGHDLSLDRVVGGGPASSDSFVWYSHPLDTAATPTSEFEAVEQTNATDLRGDSFGGGPESAGTYPEFPVGQVVNVKARPVSGEFHALEVFGGRGGPVTEVRDVGIVQTASSTTAAEAASMLRFQTDDPDAGTYSLYYSHGAHSPATLVRFADGSQPSGEVTCDVWGRSFWRRGLYLNGTDARADLPAAGVSAIMGAPFAFSVWLFPLVDDEDDYLLDNIDTSGGINLVRFATTGGSRGLRLALAYDDGGGGASDSINFTAASDYPNPELEVGAFADEPQHLLITADEPDGSTIEMQLRLNGRLLTNSGGSTTWTITGGQLGTSANAMRIGASLSAGNWATTIVNEPAVFDYVPTQAEAEAIMTTPDLTTLAAAKRPEHYHPDPDEVPTSPTTWTDSGDTGSQNGTITNGTWGKPVPVGDLVCAAAKAFDIAQVSSFDLGTLFDSIDAPVGFPMSGDQTPLDLLDRIRWTDVGWWVPVLSTGTWTYYRLTDWRSATPDVEIVQEELVASRFGGVPLVPPRDFGLTYGVVGFVQDLPPATGQVVTPVSVKSEYKTARYPVPGAAKEHGATDERVLPAGWVGRSAADQRAAEVAAILALMPIPASMTDRAVLEDVAPGQVAKISARGAPGGVAHVLVTDVEKTDDRRTVGGLALAV